VTDQGLTELPLYPEARRCTAPATARILEMFTTVACHQLTGPDHTVVRTFHPELTDLQHQVLDLLEIPTAVYSPAPKMPLKAVREERKPSHAALHSPRRANPVRWPAAWLVLQFRSPR